MGKLLEGLNKQLLTANKEDAENCIKIYEKIKDISNGHVWESQWNPLVSTSFLGTYPKSIRVYKPTSLGRVFLDGIESKKLI